MDYKVYVPSDDGWKPTDENPLNLLNSKKTKALVIGQVQSGKTNFMIEQARKALELDYDSVIVIGGTNNNLLNQTINRFFSSFKGELIFFDIKNTKFSEIPKGKSLITTLKGTKSLEKLLDLISNSKSKKILIFDDESDFGSINTSKTETPTSINNKLSKLYDSIDSGLYVSITATPFADILSKESKDISYIHVLKPNIGYTGIEFFEKNNIYETMQIEKGAKKIDKKNIRKILLDHIKRVLDSGVESSQLLFNNNLGKTFHVVDFSNVVEVLIDLNKMPLVDFFPEHDYKKIISILHEMIENTIILNGDDLTIGYDEEKHSIVIGGSLVSRGFTFKKLITTVITNEPIGKQSADTLLQRARWFGYREEIYKYMKVYTTDSIVESLKECQELVEYLNKSISEEEKDKEIIKDEILKMKFKYIVQTGKGVLNGK